MTGAAQVLVLGEGLREGVHFVASSEIVCFLCHRQKVEECVSFGEDVGGAEEQEEETRKTRSVIPRPVGLLVLYERIRRSNVERPKAEGGRGGSEECKKWKHLVLVFVCLCIGVLSGG